MLLRKDDPWIDALPIPDVRDWRVIDADGETVGFVQTIVIDRPDDIFEAVMTGANDRFNASEIEIGSRVVRVKRSLERRERPVENAAKAYRHFEDAYRDHFKRILEEKVASFETVLPSYKFGRRIALDADFSGRTFKHAEEDVRGRYVSSRFELPYEAARPAIQFGYRLGRSLDRSEEEGMAREWNQIMGPAERSVGDAARTGTSMGTGEPIAEDRSAQGS